MNLERAVCIVGTRPKTSAPYHPPFSGRDGRNLRAIAGIATDAELRQLFDLVYLLQAPSPIRGWWDAGEAKKNATDIMRCSQASILVLVGARVQEAFHGPTNHSGPWVIAGGHILFTRGSTYHFCIPQLRPDQVYAHAVKRLFRFAVQLARGESVDDLFCATHFADRIDAPDYPNRRLYECGCEVLT